MRPPTAAITRQGLVLLEGAGRRRDVRVACGRGPSPKLARVPRLGQEARTFGDQGPVRVYAEVPVAPPRGEGGGAPRRYLIEASRFAPIAEHRPRRPASRQAQAHIAVGAGAGQPRSGA